ncbi:MAG: CaiB/BaiF CoA transferase family protein [Burkholderiales bacterium]
MQRSSAPSRALSGIRVLELAGALSAYCGKMFAELGADVILIEPPGGAATRATPPFIHDEPGADRSLAFGYFNTSKRGITLDLDSEAGQALFRALAKDADLVVETLKPGALATRACGYEALAAVNPSLVMTSITGFGQTGPYAQYEWEDLIGLATGGFLYLGGYTDSPPIGAYGEQALLGASMYGAVASMLALTRAEASGEGEHVDVSMQECMVMAMETAVQFYDLEGKVRKRHADVQRFAGTGVFECSDGYIYMMASGIGANKFWPLSLQWLVDEKVPGVERLQGEEWNAVEYVGTEEAKRMFEAVFGPWAKTKTKAYLYEEGQRRHIPMAAINTPVDLLASPQLAQRSYFVELAHPALTKPMRMPGAPYRLAATPWRMEGPAPRLGEHNVEVYGELGFDADKLSALVRKGII